MPRKKPKIDWSDPEQVRAYARENEDRKRRAAGVPRRRPGVIDWTDPVQVREYKRLAAAAKRARDPESARIRNGESRRRNRDGRNRRRRERRAEFRKAHPLIKKSTMIDWGDPAQVAEKMREYKRNSARRCYARNPGKFRDRAKAYAREHPTEVAARSQRWRGENAQHVKRYQKLYRKKYYEQNRDAILEKNAAYRARHPEETAKGKLEWAKRDYDKRPEKYRAKCAKRRAKLREVLIDEAAIERFYRSVRNARRINCYWCGKKIPKGRKRHVDHIIPLARGGAHAVGNLCASCWRCNHRKSARRPEDFSGQHHFDFTPPRPSGSP